MGGGGCGDESDRRSLVGSGRLGSKMAKLVHRDGFAGQPGPWPRDLVRLAGRLLGANARHYLRGQRGFGAGQRFQQSGALQLPDAKSNTESLCERRAVDPANTGAL